MSGDYAPEIGPDGRERPKFGEYATAEEQRSRIQQPEITEALSAGVAPAEPEPATVTAAPASPDPAAVAAQQRRSPNRFITIVLLAFGAANVLLSVFSYLDLAPAIESTMQMMGIPGEFTSFEAARTWGLIAAIAMVVGYVLTAVITWRVLRAGRISWWIPLVGAVVTYIAVSACIAVPLMNDPAFTAYVSSLTS